MLGVIPLLLLTPLTADAQDGYDIARVSLVQGDVFTRTGASKDWMVATANAPVRGGGDVATGSLSRTELQFNSANILRLDQSAEARVADLSRVHIQVQIAVGRASYVITRRGGADVEIDTPNMAIRPLGAGVYRVEVNSPKDTQLTVWQGRANVAAGGGSKDVAAGEAIDVKGSGDPDYQILPNLHKDAWDRWNDERNYTIASAQSWQYTSPYYVGSEDLDRYGDWAPVPGYGWCWTPFEEAGWVPYRDGRWVSDPDYRWLWVGYEPWGWAPYHYGRWIDYNGDWCWWPGVGSHAARPVWAPGYVAFLGLGGHPTGPGEEMEFDSIGWLPLGPHDQLDPWWGSGHTSGATDIAGLNADAPSGASAQPDSGSNLRSVLTNPQIRAAVTTVSAQNFADGRIGHDLYPVNVAILEQGTVIHGPLPVTPTARSVQPVDRPVNRAALPGTVVSNLHFVTRSDEPHSPPPSPSAHINSPPRISAGLTGQVEAPRPDARADAPADRQNPMVGGPPSSVSANHRRESNDWRHFGGNPGNHQFVPAPQSRPPGALPASPPNADGGWRHFGKQPPTVSHDQGVSGPQGQGGWKHFGNGRTEVPPAAHGDAYSL